MIFRVSSFPPNRNRRTSPTHIPTPRCPHGTSADPSHCTVLRYQCIGCPVPPESAEALEVAVPFGMSNTYTFDIYGPFFKWGPNTVGAISRDTAGPKFIKEDHSPKILNRCPCSAAFFGAAMLGTCLKLFEACN